MLSLKNMFLESFMMACLMEEVGVDLEIVVLQTNHGEPVMIRRKMNCVASSFLQLELDSRASNDWPA